MSNKKVKRLLPGWTWLKEHGYEALYAAMLKRPELFAHIPRERVRKTVEDWVLIAEALAKKHKVIPTQEWLVVNRYAGLCRMLRKWPERFAHIPQESRNGKTAEEWVVIAKKLVKDYGKLPHPKWLTDNGYAGLPQMMKKRPELFTGIPQESKRGKTAEEWVAVAKKLAKEHRKIPVQKWLLDHRYSGLVKAMREQPDLFAHIPRYRTRKAPEEWVAIAKKLAKKYGKLPNPKWIQDNYKGLDQAMRSRPELFAGIPKEPRKWRTSKEWVAFAEKLAKKRGKLPNPKWLERNYSGLCDLMRKRPELFAHIPQDRVRKTREEWVAIAEKLEKKHGKLPNTKWLEKNGYIGLRDAVSKYPRLFKHIKQLRLDSKGRPKVAA